MKKSLIWMVAALMALVLCVGAASAEEAKVMTHEEFIEYLIIVILHIQHIRAGFQPFEIINFKCS